METKNCSIASARKEIKWIEQVTAKQRYDDTKCAQHVKVG